MTFKHAMLVVAAYGFAVVFAGLCDRCFDVFTVCGMSVHVLLAETVIAVLSLVFVPVVFEFMKKNVNASFSF